MPRSLTRLPLLIATFFVAMSALLLPAAAQKDAYSASGLGGVYATRPEALQFADELAARENIDAQWIRAALGQARLLGQVPRLMLPPRQGATRNWRAYRSRFVEPVRIAAGVRFWREHAQTLARAERDYGVPPEIIVGIIGVETIYGRNMGNFRVLDALATLTFDFPAAHPRAEQRQAYFRDELARFLVQQYQARSDPTVPLGSYAGATGMPQFMPTSIARYAVDYDGDGRIDLDDNPTDVIGSVAHYFQSFGWQPGMPSTFAVSLSPATTELPRLRAPDIQPTFRADDLAAAGVQLEAAGRQYRGLMALIELPNGPSAPAAYVAGTQNFYVITRYNWSAFYAMSVLDLSQAVKAAMNP